MCLYDIKLFLSLTAATCQKLPQRRLVFALHTHKHSEKAPSCANIKSSSHVAHTCIALVPSLLMLGVDAGKMAIQATFNVLQSEAAFINEKLTLRGTHV